MPSKRIHSMSAGLFVLLVFSACFRPAAAQEYNPGDVAVVNRILRENDSAVEMDFSDVEDEAEREFLMEEVNRPGILAGHGWKVDRPETWQPFEIEDSYLKPDSSRTPSVFDLPEGKAVTVNRVVWDNSRIVELVLAGAGLKGELDLTGLTHLARLNINDNEIERIKGLDTLPNLRSLELWRNKIDDIGDLGAIKGLRRLNLHGNPMKRLVGLEKLVDLTFLEAGGGSEEFRIPNLGGLTKLQTLTLSAGGLFNDMGDLSGLTELEFLTVYWRRAKSDISVDLKNCRKLKKIDFSGTQVSRLGKLSCQDTLVELFVRDTLLQEAPNFAGMKTLKSLDIRGVSLPASEKFLDTLPDGMLEELRILSSQFKTFRLRDKPLGNLKRLYVHMGDEVELLDLSGHRLEFLQVETPWVGAMEKLTPDRLVADRGSVTKARIVGSGYTMRDLRGIYDKLGPQAFIGLGNHARLGDVTGEFKVGTPYTPAQLSPRLAEEFRAAGPGATIVAFETGSMFIDLNSDHPFENGKLTFVEPGGFSVLIQAENRDGGDDGTLFRVIYTDRFEVVESAK